MMERSAGMSLFERYLSVWVAICILVGIGIGRLYPSFAQILDRAQLAHISVPVAILIWFMIFPMMVQIDFARIRRAGRQIRPLALTLTVNWAIQPFAMAGLSSLFFFVVFRAVIPPDLAREYYAGAILFGTGPCTAMVFVWSYLTRGDAAYTLIQVAVNNLVLAVLYAPIVMFLLGLSSIFVPYETILLSVGLYVVIPLAAGYASRRWLISHKGDVWFRERFLPRLKPVTIVALLLTLVILFSYQGGDIVRKPLHILYIAIPYTIQAFLVFGLAYGAAWVLRLPHRYAAPAAMIGASNFFELAVAAAVALFGLGSGAALATVVGVLVEVPIMMTLVSIANRTRKHFARFEEAAA